MIIVFDLDDTLYDEISFVKSGFRAVSNYLYNVYSLPFETSFKFMIKNFENNSRGHVFNDLLQSFKLYSKKNVKKCLSVYRNHKPDIELYPKAVECLNYLERYPIYIVTDGNKIVQKNKLIALGIYDRVKFCFLTNRYGIRNAKPSPYCFLKICEREKVAPQQVVYIGDNPYKDFVGIKPLGFKTIRVLTGQFKNIRNEDEFEAEYGINTLSELITDKFDSIFDNKNQDMR